MDDLATAPVLPILGDINMVASEKIESGIQDNDSLSVVVKKETSVVNDRVCAKKRNKEKLGYTSEELETFSKRVKVEAFEDSSNSGGLIEALKRLTFCKAKRDSCEGCSDRNKENADNEVSLAESLLHAEILLEWVKTRDELKVAKTSLEAKDGEVINLKNQIIVMRNELKDASQIYSEDTIMKHILLARIVMMMESTEATAYLNVKEEIETFKLKFPEIDLEEYGMFVENSLVHAEASSELVRTRNELKMAKGSLKFLDGEITKLTRQVTVMENESKDVAVKHTMLAKIGMMLELNETKATWNVKEEIETFRLKFPESNLEDWDVYLNLRTPVAK